MMKPVVLITFCCLVIFMFSGCSKKSSGLQTEGSNSSPANEFPEGKYWKDADKSANECKGKVLPLNYRLLSTDTSSIKQKLVNEASQTGSTKDTIDIEIPIPDGTWETFRIYQVQVMSPELAEKYPFIKTYSGTSKIYPADQIRLEVNPAGVHAMIMSTRGTILLDPYCNNDKVLMISFFKKDMPEGSKEEFERK